MPVGESHTIEGLIACADALRGGETIERDDLCARAGWAPSDCNGSYIVFELRRRYGEVIQTEGHAYYISDREIYLEPGVCVRTPHGVGLIKYAREGFTHVTVSIGEGLEQTLVKVDRASCSTIGR